MFGSQISKEIEQQLLPLTERIEALEKQNKHLGKELKSLRSRLEALEEKAEEKSEANQLLVESPKEVVEEKAKVAEPVEQVLFLAAPDKDGTFTGVSDTELEGQSLYRLVTTDGVHGRFSLLTSHDALATALISVSQMLKPVCRVTTDGTGRPNCAVNINEGEASCEDGLWKVVTKAEVKLVGNC